MRDRSELHDLQRYLVEEFAEDYLDGGLSRRDLFRRVLLMTGSVAVTASALAAFGVPSRQAEAAHPIAPRPAQAPLVRAASPDDDDPTAPPPAQTTDNVVSPTDPAIKVGMVTYAGLAGNIFGYLAQPADDQMHPGIIIVHENRGLIEPNKDIARRYAKRGYVALAPDLVSRAGGTDQFMDDLAQATGALGRSSPDDLVDDLLASVSYISALVSVDSALLGATGFCMGGGLVWRLIEAATNIKSAVPFYGPTPPLDNVPNINAAVLGIYAELDTRITGSSDALYTALNAAGIPNDKWIAPGANHGFFNNTGGVYHPTDALEAWQRALAWFAKTLIA